MSTWGLIPVKDMERAKSRLSSALSAAARRELAMKLFTHVVSTLEDSPSIDAVAVVSDSVAVREHARGLGLVALSDPPGRPGLAAVIDTALDELSGRGAETAIVCMSDLPRLTADDVTGVARAATEADVVLVPDRCGRGTNVIAVTPPTVLPSCLGHADSLLRHFDRARSLGLTVQVQLNQGIAFDLDVPDDLALLRERHSIVSLSR